MTKKMLKFVDLKQENPNKRATDKKENDFNEIYDEFIKDKASEQSADAPNAAYHFVINSLPSSK